MTVGIVHEVRMAGRAVGSPAVRLSDTASGNPSQAHLRAEKKLREKPVIEGLKVGPLIKEEDLDAVIAIELAWYAERERFEAERAERERVKQEQAQALREKVLRDRGDMDS